MIGCCLGRNLAGQQVHTDMSYTHAYLSMALGWFPITAEEVHVRMRAHDITINLLHHLCILSADEHQDIRATGLTQASIARAELYSYNITLK